MKQNSNVLFVASRCLKTPAYVQMFALMRINYNTMKRNIKIFLTISFFIFGIRQIMLYNDFILSIYLFIISAAIKTANDD